MSLLSQRERLGWKAVLTMSTLASSWWLWVEGIQHHGHLLIISQVGRMLKLKGKEESTRHCGIKAVEPHTPNQGSSEILRWNSKVLRFKVWSLHLALRQSFLSNLGVPNLHNWKILGAYWASFQFEGDCPGKYLMSGVRPLNCSPLDWDFVT